MAQLLEKDGEAVVYAQLDANLDTNPKIRKAGALGRQVFEFVLRRNALRGSTGNVPAAFVDPDYLADILMITRDDAVTGVTKAVTARLISIDDDGVVWIVGWHESWGRRAKEGKERTRKWRDRKSAKEQDAMTAGDVGDETSSHVTVGDESDVGEKRREEKKEDTHTRARERHPAAGRIARAVWDHGAKVRDELNSPGLRIPPWALMPGTSHSGWVSLLDRVCELLVDHEAPAVEAVCRNRIDVAAAKARTDGDGNWFTSTAMFKRGSFESFAELDPKSFGRKPAKKPNGSNGTIGSSTVHTSYGDQSRPAREVL
jgi:hypothetical protein